MRHYVCSCVVPQMAAFLGSSFVCHLEIKAFTRRIKSDVSHFHFEAGYTVLSYHSVILMALNFSQNMQKSAKLHVCHSNLSIQNSVTFFFFKLKVKVPLSKPLCQKSMVRYNNSAFIPETGTEGVQDNALDAGVLQTVLSPWTRRLSTENGELSRLLTCEV